jgi:hypothetical protein
VGSGTSFADLPTTPKRAKTMKREYHPHHHDERAEEVDFDLVRMKKSIESGLVMMPEGMTREKFREWVRENAEKCRTK